MLIRKKPNFSTKQIGCPKAQLDATEAEEVLSTGLNTQKEKEQSGHKPVFHWCEAYLFLKK